MKGDEPLTETLILLISELVTNAVVHTGCPAVLRMLFGSASGAGTVRVEVADASCRPPRQRHAEGEDTGGRGLELVDGLADRWGWQPEGAGKRIWCEIDREVPAVPAAPAGQAAPIHRAAPVRQAAQDDQVVAQARQAARPVTAVPGTQGVPGAPGVSGAPDVAGAQGLRGAAGARGARDADHRTYEAPRAVKRRA